MAVEEYIIVQGPSRDQLFDSLAYYWDDDISVLFEYYPKYTPEKKQMKATRTFKFWIQSISAVIGGEDNSWMLVAIGEEDSGLAPLIRIDYNTDTGEGEMKTGQEL